MGALLQTVIFAVDELSMRAIERASLDNDAFGTVKNVDPLSTCISIHEVSDSTSAILLLICIV